MEAATVVADRTGIFQHLEQIEQYRYQIDCGEIGYAPILAFPHLLMFE